MSDPRQEMLFDAEPAAATHPSAPDAQLGRPEPVPDQRAAIEDRGRDLFLTAGAGTGKTTVLVARFCDIVCAEDGDEADVGVENVLAFTFTERAAGELTRRIRLELADRAAREPDPARARRLRALARDSESAWISTIHAFCRRVLAAHPFAAGLDPGFTVLDETEAARVGAEAFEAAFSRFGERGGDDRFEMAAAFKPTGLREIVRAAHDELRARGDARPALPGPRAVRPGRGRRGAPDGRHRGTRRAARRRRVDAGPDVPRATGSGARGHRGGLAFGGGGPGMA